MTVCVRPTEAATLYPGVKIDEIDRNTVSISPPFTSQKSHFTLTGGAQVAIGPNANLGSLYIHAVSGVTVSIGSWFSLNGSGRILAHEPSRVSIGDGCLFAGGVEIATSDMHSILDAKTGRRINPARGVTIGDRVWLGQNVTILKGATIGNDCVIGAGAVVSGYIPAGCVAVGVPARVVRRGITWDISLTPKMRRTRLQRLRAKIGRLLSSVAKRIRALPLS